METKTIKRFITVFMVASTMFAISLAGDLASISVEVNPNKVKAGEPTDLTIKALDDNGDVIEDYDGTVTITLENEGGDEIEDGVILPGDGSYDFQEEDQGEKKFIKGLKIDKEGDYKVVVEDFDTEIQGTADIKVVNAEEEEKGTVKITTPQNGETITDSTVSVVGSAEKYRNNKVEVLIDKKKVAEGLVDDTGTFQIDVENIENGTHKIKVNIVDMNGKVLVPSDEIIVTVKANVKLLKDIEILSSEEVDQGTLVTVDIKTDTKVKSAILKVENYGEYPMDKKGMDSFTTQFKANTPGVFNISLILKGDFGEKKYENIKKLTVKEKIAIKTVKFIRDNNAKTIALSWDYSGQIPAFKVVYGTEKDKLNESKLVNENKYTIENIDETKTYFIKIIPTDSNGSKIGEESKLLVIEPDMKKAAGCKIDNIKLKNFVEGKKHYLVWDSVTGAIEYIVYSGKTTGDMVEVAHTTGTNYLVPFNHEAKKEQYAYFSVKAVCDDGSEQQIDKVKRVKVGPMDWLIYALLISVILYGIKLSLRKSE